MKIKSIIVTCIALLGFIGLSNFQLQSTKAIKRLKDEGTITSNCETAYQEINKTKLKITEQQRRDLEYFVPSEYIDALANDYGYEAIVWFDSRKIPLNYIRLFNGSHYFDIIQVYEENVPIEQIKMLSEIKRKDKSLFKENDIPRIFGILMNNAPDRPRKVAYTAKKRKEIPQLIKIIKDLANVKNKDGTFRFDRVEVRRFAQLGYTKDNLPDFIDTEKPNAVIEYPFKDWNGAFESEESINIFKYLQETYDIMLVIAKKEQKVYNAIDKILDKTIEFLMLSGHGSKKDITLNEEDAEDSEGANNEEYTFDKSDTELSTYLNKLSLSAVIFLNSCNNAEGGKEEKDNFANFVIDKAGGRKIMASKDGFKSSHMNIESLYPFDIRIIKDGKDITYSNK